VDGSGNHRADGVKGAAKSVSAAKLWRGISIWLWLAIMYREKRQ